MVLCGRCLGVLEGDPFKGEVMSVYFTDSDCEIWYTDVDELGINFLPMPYLIDGKEFAYDMGRNTDFHALYEKMRGGAMPTTAALNPQDYIDAFEPIFARGEDILYVHFSSELSGTFNHLRTALNELKEKYPERKCTMFDTKSICYGAGVIALEGARLHKAGLSDDEIIARLEELKKRLHIEFMVDSLSHLRRGGRISATSAVFGAMLGIKPILKCDKNGKIVKIATQKGKAKALAFMADRAAASFDYSRELYLVDADDKVAADLAEKILREKLGDKIKIRRLPVGPVIGAHCGPGTIGFIYFNETANA